MTKIQLYNFRGGSDISCGHIHRIVPGFTGTPPEDPRYSDVNWVRRVIGEQVKVPPPTVPGASSPAPSQVRRLLRRLRLYAAVTSPR